MSNVPQEKNNGIKSSDRAYRITLCVLLLLATCVRFWGIWFRHFSFDEWQLVGGGTNLLRSITHLWDGRSAQIGNLNIVTIYGIAGKYLAVVPVALGEAIWPDDRFKCYQLSRLLCSFVPNVLTIYVVYRICLRLPSRGALVIGTLGLLAVSFKHAETAHYAVADSLVTLFAACCLYFLMRTVSEDARLRDVALCAVFAALGASTKINVGGCLVLTILFSLIVQATIVRGHRGRIIRHLLFGIMCFSVICIITNAPYLARWREWWAVVKDHAVDYSYPYRGHILFHFFSTPVFGIGVGSLMMGLVGLAAAFRQRYLPLTYPLLIFVGVFYTFLSTAKGGNVRWIIPMLPILAVFGGICLEWVHETTKAWMGKTMANGLATVLLLAVMVHPAYQLCLFNLNLAESETTYTRARNYMASHGPAEKWIGHLGQPTVRSNVPNDLNDIETVDELDSGRFDYVIVCDFFHPLRPRYPRFLTRPEPSRTRRQQLVDHVRRNWMSVDEFRSRYHTDWGGGIAKQRVLWIYRREDS